jgi:N-acetyltransferase
MVQPASPFVPVTLEGTVVRLEPLRPEHESLFWQAAKNDLADIFRWIPYPMQTPDDFHRYMDRAFAEQHAGQSVVFATVACTTGTVIGSTRFMNIDSPNRKVEIGSTWIAPAWQRTGCNTEAKFLMLQHAFEVCDCIRVELKTDALNHKSRNAILRIGAKEEGTLRRHLITSTGRVRDSVYFSILDHEWPKVKHRLQARMERA